MCSCIACRVEWSCQSNSLPHAKRSAHTRFTAARGTCRGISQPTSKVLVELMDTACRPQCCGGARSPRNISLPQRYLPDMHAHASANQDPARVNLNPAVVRYAASLSIKLMPTPHAVHHDQARDVCTMQSPMHRTDRQRVQDSVSRINLHKQ